MGWPPLRALSRSQRSGDGKGETMTLEQIVARDAELHSLPMGPERWYGDIELRKQKVSCSDYRHSRQKVSFSEWLLALSAASKLTEINWATDKIRADYYEGQPDAWVDYYDGGDSPEDAIASDLDYWED
jgi:hypothetical protein